MNWSVKMPSKESQAKLSTDKTLAKTVEIHNRKKSYFKPILVKYGPLTNLTGAGTGTKVEAGGGPFRRP